MKVEAIIHRGAKNCPLRTAWKHCRLNEGGWDKLKTVCVFRGIARCGKTTYALNFMGNRKVFYFSFAGLDESLAEELFAERVSAQIGVAVSGWEDSFRAISSKFKIILLDDLAALVTYKRFHKVFYDNMITDIRTRPFVVLIAQPTDNLDELADRYVPAGLDYFSIPEVMKLRPSLSRYEALGLSAISGGIPKIMRDYDCGISFEENLRKMINPSGAFVRFMPELLATYFRRPENYHRILDAIANGNHSVSEVGKFTGFAYNKCDNYLAGLIACGVVEAEKVKSKRGAEKTAYRLKNHYFGLWYKYIFTKQADIQLGGLEYIDAIVRSIIDNETHAFHLQKAFAHANKHMRWKLWSSFEITEELLYAPKKIVKGKFQYTFDAIVQHKGKAVFVKVFKDPAENCKKAEIEKIRKAISLVNTYYDSYVYIFTKRRFSDYAVAEAAKDRVIKLIEVERLKF